MKSDSTPLLQDAEIPLTPAELEVNDNLNSRDVVVTNFYFRYFVDNILRRESMLLFKLNSTMHGDLLNLPRRNI
jgi:hypothetical protein